MEKSMCSPAWISMRVPLICPCGTFQGSKEPFTVHIWHALRNIHADVFMQTGHHTSTNFVNKSSLVDKIQKTKKVTFRYLNAIIFQISVFILSYMPILTSIFSALKPRTICIEDIISYGQDIISYSISQTA